MTLKVAVIGATGYSGGELLRLLALHDEIEVASIHARVTEPTSIEEYHPHLAGLGLPPVTPVDVSNIGAEIVFLALPHTVSMEFAPLLLKEGHRVIDMSADFRLKDTRAYEKWYKKKHLAPSLLDEAIYGLPEIYREQIKGARLVANPGCYPTAVILGLYPILKELGDGVEEIIADCKSGASGAGRRAGETLLFCEVNEDIRAYKVINHQHKPEMEEQISSIAGKTYPFVFTPHLVPLNRGILATLYVKFAEEITESTARDIFQEYYEDEPFVKILPEGKFPKTVALLGTNRVDIGIAYDKEAGWLVVCVGIDNLGKGASGQAVQNMNIMAGFDERKGLELVAPIA